MDFRPFYLGCLAHGSYLIADGGEAAVIDPQRDVDQYIEAADQLGAKIRWVIESHLHADFVSGHNELARRTGATIVFGRAAGVGFGHKPVGDGDELEVGEVTLKILETPGHTPESISILVTDPEGVAPPRLLTGDTLFIGDVGRPDLVAAKGRTSEEMAADLYRSLRDKILPLPAETEVWPAHGAGSACGKNISKERSSTLAAQKTSNWAFAVQDEAEFVRRLVDGLAPPPAYFPHDAGLNRDGVPGLDQLPAVPTLDPAAVQAHLDAGRFVLDVRSPARWGAGHVPGSINIGLGGQFASWVGTVLPFATPLCLIVDSDEEVAEARVRLGRVGFDEVVGALEFSSWAADERATGSVEQVMPVDLEPRRLSGHAVLDVRRIVEYEGGHVPGAAHLTLADLPNADPGLVKDEPLAVICAGGYRSSIACSLLARKGYSQLVNIVGGTNGWRKAGLAVES